MSTVQREWVRNGARVTTVHPQYGPLYRGRISLVRRRQEPQARLTWALYDVDHFDLPEVVGDYLDAEAALLAASPELDEPDPANTPAVSP